MCGLLPFEARMLNRRKSLGYVEVELTDDSLWGEKGATARGHEFHYSELKDEGVRAAAVDKIYRMKRLRTGEVEEEGFRKGSVLASYAHLHFPSRPEAVRRFHALCAG